MIKDAHTDERAQGLRALLRRAATQVFEHEDPAAFGRWLANEGPSALTGLGLEGVSGEAARPFLGLLARAIWNATPLPSYGFRPLPRPEPAPDEACSCGSGGEFGQCCGRLPPFPAIPEQAVWEALVESAGLEKLTAAARAGAVPGAALGRLGERLREAGQAAAAAELLRAAFLEARDPDASFEHALDTLVELTTELQGEKARDALVEELLGRLKPPLRGALWGHRASMAADAGDLSSAWRLLEQGWQDDPDSPSLAALELTLLSAEERFDDLRHRARFWRGRFGKLHEPGEVDEFMGLLDRVIENPRALAHEDEDADADEGGTDALGLGAHTSALVAAIETGLARPLPDLALELNGSEGRLLAAAETRAVELRWHAFWSQAGAEGRSAASPTALLELLADNGALFDSLGVLQGLLELAQELEQGPRGALPGRVVDRLFERGDGLLRRALREAPASLRLPWSALENRPALTFLADLARRYEQAGRVERARSCCEALLAFDPEATLGARELLARLGPRNARARPRRGGSRRRPSRGR